MYCSNMLSVTCFTFLFGNHISPSHVLHKYFSCMFRMSLLKNLCFMLCCSFHVFTDHGASKYSQSVRRTSCLSNMFVQRLLTSHLFKSLFLEVFQKCVSDYNPHEMLVRINSLFRCCPDHDLFKHSQSMFRTFHLFSIVSIRFPEAPSPKR